MRALLCNPAAVNDENLIGIADGFQSVRDHEDRFLFCQCFDRVHEIGFVFGIDICS